MQRLLDYTVALAIALGLAYAIDYWVFIQPW
jgi:hypothetical protein